MTSSLNYPIGQELAWVPTGALKGYYDLVTSDSTVLATLDMSSGNSKVHATVPEGTLFFWNENVSGSKLDISASEQGPPIATYQRKFGITNGQLTFLDGHSFKWSRTNFWGTQRAWTDTTSTTPYVQFSTKGVSSKFGVVIHPPAANRPELSLLVVLGLYNTLKERRSAENVSVISSLQ